MDLAGCKERMDQHQATRESIWTALGQARRDGRRAAVKCLSREFDAATQEYGTALADYWATVNATVPH